MRKREGYALRVVILSDSHGFLRCFRAILETETKADAVFFLGDGYQDVLALRDAIGGKPLFCVKGNCDMSSCGQPVERTQPLAGAVLSACHGHTRQVKSGLTALKLAAQENGASVALYGHTHVPAIDFSEGILFLNPGSAADARYATLELTPGKMPYPTLHEL